MDSLELGSANGRGIADEGDIKPLVTAAENEHLEVGAPRFGEEDGRKALGKIYPLLCALHLFLVVLSFFTAIYSLVSATNSAAGVLQSCTWVGVGRYSGITLPRCSAGSEGWRGIVLATGVIILAVWALYTMLTAVKQCTDRLNYYHKLLQEAEKYRVKPFLQRAADLRDQVEKGDFGRAVSTVLNMFYFDHFSFLWGRVVGWKCLLMGGLSIWLQTTTVDTFVSELGQTNYVWSTSDATKKIFLAVLLICSIMGQSVAQLLLISNNVKINFDLYMWSETFADSITFFVQVAAIYVTSEVEDKNMIQVLAEKSVLEIITYLWPPISIMLSLDGLEEALATQYVQEEDALKDDDDTNDDVFVTDTWRQNDAAWISFVVISLTIVGLLSWLIITKIESLVALGSLLSLNCSERAAMLSTDNSTAYMCTTSIALLCGKRDKNTVPMIFGGTGANLPVDKETRWSIELGCSDKDDEQQTCIIPDGKLTYDCVTPTSITPETFAFTLDVTRGAYWTNAIAKALDHNPRRLNVRDCAYETPQFKVWRYENETACMSAITTRNDEDALEWLLPLNYTSRHSYPIGGGKGTAAKEEAEANAKMGPAQLQNSSILAAAGSTPSDTLYFQCLVDKLPCCRRFNWMLSCGTSPGSIFATRVVNRANCSSACGSTLVSMGGTLTPYLPCSRNTSECLVSSQ